MFASTDLLTIGAWVVALSRLYILTDFVTGSPAFTSVRKSSISVACVERKLGAFFDTDELFTQKLLKVWLTWLIFIASYVLHVIKRRLTVVVLWWLR